MEPTINEEEAARQFAAATVSLIKAIRFLDSASLVREIRRIVMEAHAADSAGTKTRDEAKPLLLNARQAAKSLSISTGTLHNFSAPRGPIPIVKIGARTCYAVTDIEAAIEKFRLSSVKPV